MTEPPDSDAAGGAAPHGDTDRTTGPLSLHNIVQWLFWTGIALGGMAVAGATVQGLVRGLTFGVLLQWGALFVVALPIVGALVVAWHARGGTQRAQQRD